MSSSLAVPGRFRRTTSAGELALALRSAPPRRGLPPCWNVAPGREALVLRFNPGNGKRSLDPLRWGLVPHGSPDGRVDPRLATVRAETVDRLPAFRSAFAKRRCLVPAEGFYLWRRVSARKVPHYAQLKHGDPFVFAGLWEGWQDPVTGEWSRTFAIVTCPANERIERIHPRMPVILPPKYHAAWLGEEESLIRKAFLVPYDPNAMEVWEVSPQVESADADGPELAAKYQET